MFVVCLKGGQGKQRYQDDFNVTVCVCHFGDDNDNDGGDDDHSKVENVTLTDDISPSSPGFTVECSWSCSFGEMS